jgi:hypothetical protein
MNMTANDHEPEATAVAKLEAVVEEMRKRHVWSDDEVAIVQSMIKVWRGALALGVLFGATKQILIWVAIFAAGLAAIRSGMLDFLGISGK